jgi:hypothetical protein
MIAKFSFNWWVSIYWIVHRRNGKGKGCFLKRTDHAASDLPPQVTLKINTELYVTYMYQSGLAKIFLKISKDHDFFNFFEKDKKCHDFSFFFVEIKFMQCS